MRGIPAGPCENYTTLTEGWRRIGRANPRTAGLHCDTGLQVTRGCPPLQCSQAVQEGCTVLYCTVLYCTILFCTVLYCAVLYWVHALDFIGGMPSLDTVFQSYEQFLGKNKDCPSFNTTLATIQ